MLNPIPPPRRGRQRRQCPPTPGLQGPPHLTFRATAKGGALLSPSQEEERELRAAAEEPRRLTARSGQRREQTSRPPGIKNPFLGRDEVEARVLLLDGRGAS